MALVGSILNTAIRLKDGGVGRTLRTEKLSAVMKECERLRESNAVLLREVQHRTKNNLQLLRSLVSIQQRDARTETEKGPAALSVIGRRISALASVHDLMHHSHATATLPVGEFVRNIGECLLDIGGPTALHINMDGIDEMAVPIDFAGPLGLILCELIAHSGEHERQRAGFKSTCVTLERTNRSLRIIVGVGDGLPELAHIDDTESGGMQIVKALVTQLNGSLDVIGHPDASWIVTVPLPESDNWPSTQAG